MHHDLHPGNALWSRGRLSGAGPVAVGAVLLDAGDPEAGEEVAQDIARRDAADSNRAASPLFAADDALVIDTTNRPIDEIVEEVLSKL